MQTIKTAVVGASGYAGAQLCGILSRHPQADLCHLYVSENSSDANKKISALHGFLAGRCDLILESLTDPKTLGDNFDAVFLATDHKVSHDIAKAACGRRAKIFDLSGAFRVKDNDFYQKHYGFKHECPKILQGSVYALMGFTSSQEIKDATLVSLPGCYPTVSQLSLKPLILDMLIDESMPPVINAVSGVSGAGRGLKLNSMFCEVSLNAYGIFTHRHQPEIASHLGTDVIFNPHLGNFKRGILATITCRLKDGVTEEQVQQAYDHYYRGYKMVRLKQDLVKLDDVVNTPCCDISCRVQGQYLVISSAIDNLLKGAASSAVEAYNACFDFDDKAFWQECL